MHNEADTPQDATGSVGTRDVPALIDRIAAHGGIAADTSRRDEFAPSAARLILPHSGIPDTSFETVAHTANDVSGGSAVAPLYLVSRNALRAEDSALQLRQSGHVVEIVEKLEDLPEYIAQQVPSAVILEVEYSVPMLEGLAGIVKMREGTYGRYPIVWISTRHHFEACLLAARTGVDFYLTRPVDFTGLSERLRRLACGREGQPYRILAVADNQARTEHYVSLLRSARMEVRRLDRLRDLLQVMDDYRPEVVLTDIAQPRCSNTDVSRLIRQRLIHFDVPIVFLSSDTSVAARMQAAQAGADDLVGMPFDPVHFVSMLQYRAERHRSLRALIMRDSLTGLYNHAAIKEALNREIARCARDRIPLSLSMIDIDFFKKVNDSYGHPVGDQVIRCLAQLLRQRLRGSDVVGRYGGEEFAAILPGTSESAAALVLDKVREAFSIVRHQADTREFTASFSAGVVDTARYANAEQLLVAADAALYLAKGRGRNRVEIG